MRVLRGSMPGKLVYFGGLISVVCVFFLFVHLESEISRLDAARVKLEHALAKLQVDSMLPGPRRAPSQYIQERSVPSLDPEDMVVIYNRVPKTGSTSFAGISYSLCETNHFHVLHVNVSRNSHVLSISDQMRFVGNVTNWKAKKPAMYHGHLAFLDFSRFGASSRPIYINIIRDPLDRLISYYYFLRNGDDFRPHIKRRKMGNKQTFDQCVMKEGRDCNPENLWLQIPFFCGHFAECWVPGSKWALEQAKQNLVHNYLVVGLTEEIGDFISVLEATLPRFFTGAVDLYNSGKKSHLRRTFNKIPPSDETIAKIHESPIWQMESEFYQFAKEHFHFIKKKTFEFRDGELAEKRQQFLYEKIRPR